MGKDRLITMWFYGCLVGFVRNDGLVMASLRLGFRGVTAPGSNVRRKAEKKIVVK